MFEEFIYNEEGARRARVVIDPDPMFDFPASAPVIRFNESLGQLVTGHGDGADVTAVRAAWRYYRDAEKMARYLRIFHGAWYVEVVETPGWNNDGFCVVATPEFVAEWGGSGNQAPSREWAKQQVKADADTLRHWLEGEVYGYEIQELKTGTITYDDDTPNRTFEDWEDTGDGCYGFFGWDDVKAAVDEVL